MRVAIVGSRSFNNFYVLENNINSVIDSNDISLIISGGERYANKYNIETLIFKPEYDKYGRKAPLIRNKTIVENCDIFIAFPTSDSRGTRHVINIAKNLLQPCNIHIYEMQKKTFDKFFSPVRTHKLKFIKC